MYTPWHNYQHIQRISCESYKNLFWKLFEGGKRISDWYILWKWTWWKNITKVTNHFEKKTYSTNNNNNNNTIITFNYYNYISLDTKNWTKNKKETQKFGFRVAFQTGPNLNNISCKNKDKLIPNNYPGVYELKCSCGSFYNDETKKKIISRSIE